MGQGVEASRLRSENEAVSIGALVTRRGRASRAPKITHADEHRIFLAALASRGIPAPVAEHRFAWAVLRRKWQMDYAWPAQKIALEVEGGAWSQGRHTRGSGFLEDMKKYNTAVLMGWRLVRCLPSELLSPNTLDMIEDLMGSGRLPGEVK